jgi:ferredoxin
MRSDLRTVIKVNPIACQAYGYCAELLPEVVRLDPWGYPIVDGGPVPRHLVELARRAAKECPRRAFLLQTAPPLDAPPRG